MRILEVYHYKPGKMVRWTDVRLAVWLFEKPLLCVYQGYWTAELFGNSFSFPRKRRIWSR